jgi:Asp-tRNA(Asn)/Glu-tRNA(Gln) amidotransferase A subunit family amidase
LAGSLRPPPASKPQRLAFLETGGWQVASNEAKQALEQATAQLARAGIEIVTRRSHSGVAAVEDAIAGARPLSARINTYESRWPLNTYRQRDASKLSRIMLDRLAQAEAMQPNDYRADLEGRTRIRGVYGGLAADCDACVTLAAPAAAPVGLGSTGDPVFAVPFSLLGVPAISLPLLREQNLPLGLQVTGFAGKDERACAVAAWVDEALGGGSGGA